MKSCRKSVSDKHDDPHPPIWPLVAAVIAATFLAGSVVNMDDRQRRDQRITEGLSVEKPAAEIIAQKDLGEEKR